jgi:hypothetical protein
MMSQGVGLRAVQRDRLEACATNSEAGEGACSLCSGLLNPVKIDFCSETYGMLSLSRVAPMVVWGFNFGKRVRSPDLGRTQIGSS